MKSIAKTEGKSRKINNKKSIWHKKILSGRAARGSTSAPFLSESSAFLSRCTRRASRRTRLTGPRVPCESSLKALYNQLANSKLVGWTLYHISNWQPHTCLNAVSVTNSKRLTTKLQRRIRKNSKYLLLNPESNLGYEQEVARKPERRPLLARSRCALARPRRAHSLALTRAASPCISRTARNTHMPLASPCTQHVPFLASRLANASSR